MRSSDLVGRSFVPGISDPRQVHEFRAEITYLNAEGGTTRLDSVLVRSIDRPAVEPQVEVVNQYNKKRTVVTGFKYRPMRMSFYDTRDSAVWRMMRDYLAYHFGDFNQPRTAWDYDQIRRFNDPTGSGFGFGARFGNRGGPTEDPSKAYFISSIVIYQGIAGQSEDGAENLTVLELVNPRITEFDFDEFDYTQSAALVVMNCTFEFEAMLFREAEDPNPLDGNTLELPNDQRQARRKLQSQLLQNRSALDPTRPYRYGPNSLNFDARRGAGGRGSGSGLGLFGAFNFGNAAQVVAGRLLSGQGFRGIGGELAFAATGNPILATILNSQNSQRPLADIGSAILGSTQRPVDGVSAALWDTARAGLVGTSLGGRAGIAYTGGVLAQGLFAVNQQNEQARIAEETRGLSLTSGAIGMVNANRPAHAQFGYNESYAPRTLTPNFADAFRNSAAAARGARSNATADWESPTGWRDRSGNVIDPP